MSQATGSRTTPRSRRRSAHVWHLVTNHQNMLYLLAAGMVTSPAGFRGKHYADPLSVYPGWIPLFRDKTPIPGGALSQATAERKHLLPCVASFDLSAVSCPVRMLSRDGRTRDVASPTARKRKADIAILIRAPLPTSLLVNISFRSPEDRKAFETAADSVSNVDLSHRQIEISESAFATDSDVEWPAAQSQQQGLDYDRDSFPAFGQALGGALGMLYQMANRSDLGLAAYRVATDSRRGNDEDLARSDPILAELPSWIDGNEISREADTRAQLFWGVVQALIDAQTEESQETPVDVVLAYLDSQRDRLPEREFQQRLERLIGDMRSCLGLGGGTITELIESHKGSLSRSLLLFCLRESCTELLEFSHPLLKDAEYVLAGVLFGVRDGWLQFPKQLRDPNVSAYVTHRMADAEHRSQGHDFSLVPPPRPKPLRELFVSSGGELNRKEAELALDLAQRCNWNDCIRTRIDLTEGDYPDSFERNGLQVVLPGRVSGITEEVDVPTFIDHLGQWPPIDSQVEDAVRKELTRRQKGEEPHSGRS